MKPMTPIYLDNNATTPMLPEVWEAMRPFVVETYGNPASAHQFGRRARQALEDARDKVAAVLDARPDEVIFTSGATEANNLAIFGLCGEPPRLIVASPVEHPSVIEPLRQLAARGFTLETLPVDAAGRVILPSDQVTETPRLVAVMLANHETGAIQPVRELAAVYSAPIHCDATQAVGRVPVSFHDLGVTSLSFSAHKFHGPKGVGALLLRHGIKLTPRAWGGHQQQGRRPGTEPVHLVVGLAAALTLACDEMEDRLRKIRALRERFLAGLQASGIDHALNGPATDGTLHTLNLSFPGVKADVLLIALDLEGIACSTGSACSSGSLLPSPVLQAMGVSDERLHSAIRFSFSHLLSEADIDEAVRRAARVLSRLKKMPGQGPRFPPRV